MSGYLITGAILIDGQSERRGTLRTEGDRIAEIHPPDLTALDLADLAARHDGAIVDGAGRWLVPGGVDPHVHFALPAAGTTTCDDFATGTQSALAGGTTTVIDFVTPGREQSLVEATERRLAEAEAACCDYALHASATAWRETTASELRQCHERFGLRSLKLYLAYLETIGLGDADLVRAMQVAAELELTVMLHCEDGLEVARRQRDLLAAGEVGPLAHARSRPPQLEIDAVARALRLAARTGCRPYVVHVSTAGALAAVAAARAHGQTVLAETCPQYLLLDESRYEAPFVEAAACVMSPPLRSRDNPRALREALERGDVDVVATDHCAFTRAQKNLGRDDFTRIPGGAAGVEHRLALLGTLGLAPAAWVGLVARRPAEIFGLYPRKGSLEPGADADLVLWDPAVEWTVSSADDHHPGDHSIWEGHAARGRAETVWSRGELVVGGGEVQAAVGRGRFLLGSSS
jgi:dihydropyrimidinase